MKKTLITALLYLISGCAELPKDLPQPAVNLQESMQNCVAGSFLTQTLNSSFILTKPDLQAVKNQAATALADCANAELNKAVTKALTKLTAGQVCIPPEAKK
jgi:hypothetical protein